MIACIVAGLLGQSPSRPMSSASSRAAKFTVSSQTTYLTGPLDADGTVNYVRAYNDLYGKGVTAENNAAIDLINALGPECLDEKLRDQILQALHMQSPPKEAGKSIEDIAFSSQFDKGLARLHTAAWSREDFPEAAAWLDKNKELLNAVVAASKKPSFHVPWVSTDHPETMHEGLLRIKLGRFRLATYGLAGRAVLAASEGRAEDASSDLLAIHRLERLMRGQLLMQDAVATFLGRIGWWAEQTILANRLFTPQQAKAHLAQLDALPKPASMSQTMDRGERYFSLDHVMVISRDGLDKALRLYEIKTPDPDFVLPDMDLDIDEYLRLTTQDMEDTIKTMRGPWPQRRQALIKAGVKDPDVLEMGEMLLAFCPRERVRKLLTETDVKDRKLLTQKIYQILSEDSILTVKFYCLDEDSATREDITRIGLALEVYRADKSEYPQRLELLEPKYLKKVPPDRFVDKPLIYRLSEKGYLVYSVGPNTKDDQGKSDLEKLDDISLEVKQ